MLSPFDRRIAEDATQNAAPVQNTKSLFQKAKEFAANHPIVVGTAVGLGLGAFWGGASAAAFASAANINLAANIIPYLTAGIGGAYGGAAGVVATGVGVGVNSLVNRKKRKAIDDNNVSKKRKTTETVNNAPLLNTTTQNTSNKRKKTATNEVKSIVDLPFEFKFDLTTDNTIKTDVNAQNTPQQPPVVPVEKKQSCDVSMWDIANDSDETMMNEQTAAQQVNALVVHENQGVKIELTDRLETLLNPEVKNNKRRRHVPGATFLQRFSKNDKPLALINDTDKSIVLTSPTNRNYSVQSPEMPLVLRPQTPPKTLDLFEYVSEVGNPAAPAQPAQPTVQTATSPRSKSQ